MSGLLPNEGENFLIDLLVNRSLEIGLFTNATVDENITHAALVEPTGGGYARKAMGYANWTVAGDTATGLLQTFSVTLTSYNAAVRGYFICTAATPKKIIAIEVDANLGGSGVVFTVGSSYDITPTLTAA